MTEEKKPVFDPDALVVRPRVISPKYQRVSSFPTLDHFLDSGEFPEGAVSILGNIPIDMQFVPKKRSKTLVVCFHAALIGEINFPFLSGAGIFADLDVSRLSISDPSLYLDTELTLGWFAGNTYMSNLQTRLRKIVKQAMRACQARRVIFFGVSGGGFAALQMSRHFKNSLAFVVNPQTSIAQYHDKFVDRYLRAAWDAPSFDDLPIEHNMVEAYRQAPMTNHVVYLQNSEDGFHIEHHMNPFLVSVSDPTRVFVESKAWGDGHVPPSKEHMKEVLERLIASKGKWASVMDSNTITEE